MAIYVCRWPNGEFSIVKARTKTDAIEMLDEWENAEQALLSRMPDCLFDFRLDDNGQIELADIGEASLERTSSSHVSPAESQSMFPYTLS
jgi:hypothetical protein